MESTDLQPRENQPGSSHVYPPPPLQNDQQHSPYTPQSLQEQQQNDSARIVTASGFPIHPVDGGKRPRACEACRGLKVRCEFEGNDPDGACKRCTKAKRHCIVTQPSRKRQKKTDSRVAELEKKIDALTATLQATQATPPESEKTALSSLAQSHAQPLQKPSISNATQRNFMFDGRYDTTPVLGHDWNTSVAEQLEPVPLTAIHTAGQKRKHRDTEISQPAAEVYTELNSLSRKEKLPVVPIIAVDHGVSGDEPDVIDRGMLTLQMADAIFKRYTQKMSLLFPAVVLAPGSTISDVRRSKPVLLLSILTAASGSEYPDLQTRLNKELVQIYANRIVVQGEKSLELVQALLVSCIWYWPPEHFEQLKFFALIHMAAVMAIDLNINRRSKNTRGHKLVAPMWREHTRCKMTVQDPSSIEARRTWLGCYFLAANAAMGLRRQNLVRWSPYLDDCLSVLESSTDAAPTDSTLCQWVRCQHIAEEVGNSFSMDDAFAVVAISDAKIQYALKGFERDLEKWSEQVPLECQSSVLKMSEHVLSLYMHEVAMHVDHNVEEFKPPFTEESLRGPRADSVTVPLTAVHINALSTCLTAIDGIFTTFLSIDIDTVRVLPVMCFVRMAYTVVVLMKMYFAAAVEGSELGKVIDKNNMRVEFYLNNLLEHLRLASADEKSKAGAKFLMVVAMLKAWFMRHAKGENSNGNVPVVSDQSASENPEMGGGLTASNTPLQLLSNLATSGSTSSQTFGTLYASQGGQSNHWQQQPQLSNHTHMYSAPPLQPRQMHRSHNGYMSNIDPSLGALPVLDYDIPNADGFEQAMGLTMESFDPRYFADDAFFGAVMDSMGGNADYFQGSGQ